jgi:hypothetical protein
MEVDMAMGMGRNVSYKFSGDCLHLGRSRSHLGRSRHSMVESCEGHLLRNL